MNRNKNRHWGVSHFTHKIANIHFASSPRRGAPGGDGVKICSPFLGHADTGTRRGIDTGTGTETGTGGSLHGASDHLPAQPPPSSRTRSRNGPDSRPEGKKEESRCHLTQILLDDTPGQRYNKSGILWTGWKFAPFPPGPPGETRNACRPERGGPPHADSVPPGGIRLARTSVLSGRIRLARKHPVRPEVSGTPGGFRYARRFPVRTVTGAGTFQGIPQARRKETVGTGRVPQAGCAFTFADGAWEGERNGAGEKPEPDTPRHTEE